MEALWVSGLGWVFWSGKVCLAHILPKEEAITAIVPPEHCLKMFQVPTVGKK